MSGVKAVAKQQDYRLWRKMVVERVPAFGPILYAMSYVEDADAGVGTFCVEPRRMRMSYSPKFAGSRSAEDNAFTLAHEVGHVLCRHMERTEAMVAGAGVTFQPHIWLAAQEMAVNALVCSLTGWPQPKDGVACPEEYKLLSTEQIYKELYKKAKPVQVACQCVKGGGKGEKGEGDGIADMLREQAVKAARESLNKEGAQQGGKQAGNQVGELQLIEIEMAPHAEPPSLKQLLRKYLIALDSNCKNFDVGTLYKRRLGVDGLALPNLSSSPIARKFVVSIDTSGSIGDDEFAEFKGILHGVAQQLGFQQIVVQHFTTEVVHTEQLFDIRQVKKLKRRASGGTAIEDADVKAWQHKGQFHVILTDGYVGWLNRYSLPTLVLVSVKGNLPPKGAENLLAALEYKQGE